MPYKSSNALVNYKLRRKEISALLRTVSPLDTSVRTAHLSAPVIRAGIVLLFSHIEGYIEDVVQEAIDKINNSGINVSTLPYNLRVAHCMPTIQEITKITDPEKLDEALKILMQSNYHFWFGDTLPPIKLETDCLTKNFANPSYEHIDKLFRNLGIRRFFGSLYSLGFKPQKIQAIKSTLDTLASLRHDIAHGNFSTSCSFLDLCRHIVVVNVFCEAVDARLGLHIKSLTGTFPWVS
ncbi:MAG: MAE_28990/MAE_18760 family HEPN-like nuclease [Firmicutes bacterium]|nr:MAE_28990/MAE_18760 family HEPN-like nuclease [Bacillota bacterium]